MDIALRGVLRQRRTEAHQKRYIILVDGRCPPYRSDNDNQNHRSPKYCHECQYFGEYYGPRVVFIYHIDKPAAVYKGLYLWSGNQAWADLCDIEVNKLIGFGIEEFVHPDSLRMAIGYN